MNFYRPDAYTAQNGGLYSTKDVKDFWNRILLTKHSDDTLHVLGKTISQEFFSPNEITSSGNTYINSDWLNNMRIGTHNRMLSLRAFFTKDWFVDMFIVYLPTLFISLTKAAYYGLPINSCKLL